MIENQMTQGNHDRDTYDPEQYRKRALDEVVETIMAFGCYPQPSKYRPRPCEFDLCEWMQENMEPDEIASFAVGQIMYDGEGGLRKFRFELQIKEMLERQLVDSDMVADMIERLHEEERGER